MVDVTGTLSGIWTVVVAGLAGGVGALVGGWIMWHWAGPPVVLKVLKERLGPVMSDYLLNGEVKTGRKIKDEETGKERDELISPVRAFGREAGKQAYYELSSFFGVNARKRQVLEQDFKDALMNPENPLRQQLMVANPKIIERALDDGDYMKALFEFVRPAATHWASGQVEKLKARATNKEPKTDAATNWYSKV